MTETIDYNKLSAIKIHSMLIDSIVKLAEASRKEGRAIEEPVRYSMRHYNLLVLYSIKQTILKQ